MRLRHHLATKTNDIPLGPASFYSAHQKRTELGDIGFAIRADYAGDKKSQKKHKYEFILSPEELVEFLQAGMKIIRRFNNPELIEALLDEYDTLQLTEEEAEEVEEEDDE